SWQVGNARVNRVLFNGEGFSLVGWNDDGHLATPEAPAALPLKGATPAARRSRFRGVCLKTIDLTAGSCDGT
ncbi:MAG: hypothetical protein H7Z19_06460, partial [Chitinophagaceae bacterium]|nr:hypothetical protein [Rubrivivax sp.]